MDQLKTYINKHRPEFDTEEPAAGHFERLEAKLAAQQPTKGRRMAMPRLRYAVAASVALLVSLGISIFFFHDNTAKIIVVAESTPCDDPATMKYCYLEKMNDTAILIDRLTENTDLFVRQTIQEEVASIIEDTQSFDEELPDELAPERAQAILSDYYRQHLETLQDIAQTLSVNNT